MRNDRRNSILSFLKCQLLKKIFKFDKQNDRNEEEERESLLLPNGSQLLGAGHDETRSLNFILVTQGDVRDGAFGLWSMAFPSKQLLD